MIRSNRLMPEYAFNSFNYMGSAAIMFYPYVFLYPLAIFLKLFSLRHAILLFYLGYSFSATLISYFSSLRLSQSRLVSYIFALIYTFSGELMAMSFYSHVTDIGVYFSAIFMPLVIFGFVAYLQRGRWLMLSIGMSLIICSNLISVAFIVILLLLWLLCNYRCLSKHRIVNLIKASLLTTLTTAFVWIPIVKMSLKNRIFVPIVHHFVTVNLMAMLHDSLRNEFSLGSQSLTVYSLLGLVMGLLLIKRLPRMVRQLDIFAVAVIILSSSIFPWGWLMERPAVRSLMIHLQTTIRLLVLPQLILEFTLAFGIVKCFHAKLRRALIALLAIVFVTTQFQIQTNYVQQGVRLTAARKGVTDSRQIMHASTTIHNVDYWPKEAIPVKHDLFRNNGNSGRELIHFTPEGHGEFDFKLPNEVNTLHVPFLYYRGAGYRCRLDGRTVEPRLDQHHLLTIRNVSSGDHQLQIRTSRDKDRDVTMGLSVISLPIYELAIRDVIRRRRN